NKVATLTGLAVVGCGNWGKNLVRTYQQLLGQRLRYACDLNEEKRNKIGREFPSLTTTGDYQKVLNDPQVQALAIATTANTHYELAKAALNAGKHVYVEKPITLKVEHAQELVALAK